jgi:hypothetical protein
MDTIYLNWARANRAQLYGGIRVVDGYEIRHSRDYSTMYVPLQEGFLLSEEQVVTQARAKQRLKLIPACTVRPGERYRVQVVVNPLLYQYATINHNQLVEHDEPVGPEIYAQFHRDFDLSQLDYLVRLYLIG